MVRPEGFELPTYRFVACCSIQLSYERPTTANIGKTSMAVKHFFVIFVHFFCFPVRAVKIRRSTMPESLRSNPDFCLDHAENVS